MRFLVTGSNGFIGSRLCSYLAGKHEVISVTRSLSADASNGLLLANLLGPSGPQLLRACQPTHLIHCAAIAHQRHPQNLAEYNLIEDVNIRLPVALARLSVLAGVKRFVFLSSIGVHGSSTVQECAFSENSQFNPGNHYARSKVFAEKSLADALRHSDCELTILRPALVYGPNAPGNLASLTRAVDLCFPFPLASVSNRRSFLSISNLLSAIEHVSLHSKAAGQAYLIADKECISTSALISLIARVRSRPSLQYSLPRVVLDGLSRFPGLGQKVKQLVDDLVVDSSKIRDQLGWVQPIAQLKALEDAFCLNPTSSALT